LSTATLISLIRPWIASDLPRPSTTGGVVLVDHDPLGAAQIVEHRVLQLEADFLGDDVAAGQHGDVAQHLLAPIAEARSLDRAHLEGAAQLVHHQGRQRLALDIFRDDEQGLAGLGHLLQHREQLLHRRDLLVVDEDVGVIQTASIFSGSVTK
jgi:hypothetical protein